MNITPAEVTPTFVLFPTTNNTNIMVVQTSEVEVTVTSLNAGSQNFVWHYNLKKYAISLKF
jgi:hypothetical protein